MMSPPRGGKDSSWRCACHSRLFPSKEELMHHLGDMPFRSVGAESYQEWFDNLDMKKPVPKPVPPPPNYTLRRITASQKLRTQEAQAQRREASIFHLSPRQSPAATLMMPRIVDRSQVPKGMETLHALLQSNEMAFDLLQYLLAYGGPAPKDEFAPESLTDEVNRAIMDLFSSIDQDCDGRIDASELVMAGKTVGITYDVLHFRKLDKARTGFADVLAVFRAFFPQFSMKKLLNMQQKLAKPAAVELTSEELLSPEHMEEIRQTYALYSTREGGCTLPNMLALISTSSWHREHADLVEALFHQHDTNKDGILELSEFVEMVKHNYPPFKQQETYTDRLPPLDLKKYQTPLDRDRRVFETKLMHREQSVKAFGVAEMLVVMARRKYDVERADLELRAGQLHVSDTVRHFANMRIKKDDSKKEEE